MKNLFYFKIIAIAGLCLTQKSLWGMQSPSDSSSEDDETISAPKQYAAAPGSIMLSQYPLKRAQNQELEQDSMPPAQKFCMADLSDLAATATLEAIQEGDLSATTTPETTQEDDLAATWLAEMAEPGDKYFKCTVPGCTFTATTRSTVHSHKKMHFMYCGVQGCAYSDWQLEKMQEHVLSHYNDDNFTASGTDSETGQQIYKCVHCSHTSSNLGAIKEHFKIHLTREFLSYHVPNSSASSFVKPQDSSHTSSKSESIPGLQWRKNIRQCQYAPACQFFACSTSQINAHIAFEHTHTSTISPKIFTCPAAGCMAKFASTNLLTAHAKIEHPEEKVFKCPNCSATYNYYKQLVRHAKGPHKDSASSSTQQ